MTRTCAGINERGGRCRQAPLSEGAYCFWHDPAHAAEAAEARRLGGLNRRRERTLQGVYDVEGLETAAQIRRVLEVALMAELGLENSHNRSRVIIAVATAAAHLLDVSELEARLIAMEESFGLSSASRRSER